VFVDRRELLGQNPENILHLMQQTVANELSPTRSPNNMMLITAVFQQSSDLAAKVPLLILPPASVVISARYVQQCNAYQCHFSRGPLTSCIGCARMESLTSLLHGRLPLSSPPMQQWSQTFRPIYVDVVSAVIYTVRILAPCCIVYVVDLVAECYCLSHWFTWK